MCSGLCGKRVTKRPSLLPEIDVERWTSGADGGMRYWRFCVSCHNARGGRERRVGRKGPHGCE